MSVVSHAQTSAPLPAQYRAYLPDDVMKIDDVASDLSTQIEQAKEDAALFRRTRSLQGSARWTMAQGDGGPGVLNAFSCAAGTVLLKDRLPAVVRLLSRYRTDLLDRTRVSVPVASPARGPLCLAGKALAMAQEAPALQSAWGWSVGMILAEAFPLRAVPIMARARAYGEGAVICGFAGINAVRRGRDLASALYARMRAQPEFSADLEAAIGDLRALADSGSAPDAATCGAEAAALDMAR